MKGIVYVLTNECMPGLIKIGRTSDGVEQRLKTLNTTAVPIPFKCHFAAEVEDCVSVERKLHFIFSDSRVATNREFFRMSPEKVVTALSLTQISDVTPREAFAETEEETRAVQNEQRRRPALNLFELGLKSGDKLTFTRNESIEGVVASERKISLEGVDLSVTAAAKRAFAIAGKDAGSINGALYWNFGGETLDELRNRREGSDGED
jgi:hypothetical protein